MSKGKTGNVKPSGEVLHRHPKAIEMTRIDMSLPQRSCICVNSSPGGLGGGHARIYMILGRP